MFRIMTIPSCLIFSARFLTLVKRGLTPCRRQTYNFVKSFIGPCSKADPVLMRKGFDHDDDVSKVSSGGRAQRGSTRFPTLNREVC